MFSSDSGTTGTPYRQAPLEQSMNERESDCCPKIDIPCDNIPCDYSRAGQTAGKPIEPCVGGVCTCVVCVASVAACVFAVATCCCCCKGLNASGGGGSCKTLPTDMAEVGNCLGSTCIRIPMRMLGCCYGLLCYPCEYSQRKAAEIQVEGSVKLKELPDRYKLFSCSAACCPTKKELDEVKFTAKNKSSCSPSPQAMN